MKHPLTYPVFRNTLYELYSVGNTIGTAHNTETLKVCVLKKRIKKLKYLKYFPVKTTYESYCVHLGLLRVLLVNIPEEHGNYLRKHNVYSVSSGTGKEEFQTALVGPSVRFHTWSGFNPLIWKRPYLFNRMPVSVSVNVYFVFRNISHILYEFFFWSYQYKKCAYWKIWRLHPFKPRCLLQPFCKHQGTDKLFLELQNYLMFNV